VKPLKQHIINIQIKTNHTHTHTHTHTHIYIYIYRTRYIHDACVESNNMVIVDDLGGGVIYFVPKTCRLAIEPVGSFSYFPVH
jgi:hypothetical protein